MNHALLIISLFYKIVPIVDLAIPYLALRSPSLSFLMS